VRVDRENLMALNEVGRLDPDEGYAEKAAVRGFDTPREEYRRRVGEPAVERLADEQTFRDAVAQRGEELAITDVYRFAIEVAGGRDHVAGLVGHCDELGLGYGAPTLDQGTANSFGVVFRDRRSPGDGLGDVHRVAQHQIESRNGVGHVFREHGGDIVDVRDRDSKGVVAHLPNRISDGPEYDGGGDTRGRRELCRCHEHSD